MATEIICLFNHKGGVSKTTTAFNLGWAMAERGHTILLVDADPQCNLTGMTLELSGREDLQEFYEKNPTSNIYACLKPAFGGQPRPIKAATPVVTRHERLWLLAGHIDLASYEPELSMAHKIGNAMPVLANLPGAMGFLFRETARELQADYVLVDMSPSIGAINQNLWLQADYFIVPTSPDYFCLMAIDSLARLLPLWHAAGESMRTTQDAADYKIPTRSPRFLGILSQRYRPRYGRPAEAFQNWIDIIVTRVQEELLPVLANCNMAISEQLFRSALPQNTLYELAQIADFNSLIAQAQEHATPIFALSEEQLGRAGVVLEQMQSSRDAFKTVFNELAAAVEGLCQGSQSEE